MGGGAEDEDERRAQENLQREAAAEAERSRLLNEAQEDESELSPSERSKRNFERQQRRN